VVARDRAAPGQVPQRVGRKTLLRSVKVCLTDRLVKAANHTPARLRTHRAADARGSALADVVGWGALCSLVCHGVTVNEKSAT